MPPIFPEFLDKELFSRYTGLTGMDNNSITMKEKCKEGDGLAGKLIELPY